MKSLRIAILLFVLTGCGGGGGGSAPLTAAPAPSSTASGNSATTPATLRIVVPPSTQPSGHTRAPAFVSSAAQSISIALYLVAANGTIASTPLSTTNVDLVASSACTGTPLACTISLNVPIGTVTFGATLYAGTGETGAVLALVAPSAQHEFTVIQNARNILGLSLSGVPATLSLTTVPATVTSGTASTAVVSVVARDAAGNTIIGSDPYAAPITLTDSDSSGHTSLSGTSIASPQSTVNLVYGGLALSGTSFNLVATYAATPPLTSTWAVGILSSGVVTAVPAAPAFLSLNDAPIDVAYGEASYSGTFTVDSTACTGIVTVVNNPGSLHLTPVAAGSCTISITDNAGHSTSVPVTVNTTSFSAQ